MLKSIALAGARIQVASDLHLPHWRCAGHPLHLRIDPRANILVLAGDLCNGLPGPEDLAWLEALSDEAAWPVGIFFVLGNHDCYGLNLSEAATAWRLALRDTRIQVLQRDVAQVCGLRIAGCTYWTDFDRSSPLLPFFAQKSVSDYRYLCADGRLATPQDVLSAHHHPGDSQRTGVGLNAQRTA